MDVLKTTVDVTICLLGYVFFICLIGLISGKIGELLKPKKGDRTTMTIKEFEKMLLTEANKEHIAIIESVLKHGDVERRGIVIDRPDEGAAPIHYIDDLYEIYRHGTMDMQDLINAILDIKTPKVNPSKLLENIDESLCYRLLNIKNNRKLLENVPYKTICDDMALCLDVREYGENGIMATLINKDIFKLKMWDLAVNIAPFNAPAVLRSMLDMMDDVDDNILITGEIKDEPMYVLSVEKGIYGASALFYDGVKERIYDIFGEYYALPSSIHEWIIVPVKNGTKEEVDEMKELVVTANRTVVEHAEVLSDNPYIYDGKELRIA